MTDNVTNELLLETLKAIQTKLSDMASDLHDLKADMRGIKGHMAAFMQIPRNRQADLAGHSSRARP